MNTRERFHAVMGFRPFDRLPVVEWAGWWDQTLARWHREQLPATLLDRYEICRHFGLDLYRQEWFRPRRPTCPSPPAHGAGILADEAGYAAVRPHLYPAPAVSRQLWEGWAAEQERGEAVLWFTVDGFFWFPRTLLGIERHLLAFYDQPRLLHRMNEDLSECKGALLEECTGTLDSVLDGMIDAG